MSFLSVELGGHRIKVVLLEKAGGVITILKEAVHSVPDSPNAKALRVRFLKDFVDQHGIHSRKVFLAISDPNVITTKSTILPVMPASEMALAIQWHAKEEGSVGEDQELFNYEVVKDFSGEDTGKQCAVNYSIVNPKELDQYLTLFIRSGFEVTQVTTVPLDYTRVLAGLTQETAPTAVLDVGYSHTTLSIYRHGKMIFIRSLSFALSKVRAALNDPLFLGTQYKGPGAEAEIEKAFQVFGIPVDGAAAPEDSGKSRQFWELIRPLLEGLVRELRYSITYFMTNLKEEKPASVFLAGHGAEIKGLEAFLAKELGMGGFNLLLPPKIQNKAAGADLVGQYVGAVAGVFSGGDAVDFMPLKFRNRRIEKYQREILMLITIAVAGFLAMAFVFAKMRTSYFEDRLKMDQRQLQSFGKIAQVSQEFYPRFHLDNEIDRTSIPAERVLRLLGHLLPPEIVLRSFMMDAEERQMSLRVSVELPADRRETAVRQFVKRLHETSFFSKVTEAPIEDLAGLYKIEGEFRND